MRIKDVAEAFLKGRSAKVENAKTDGQTYWLHGHPIAKRTPQGVQYDWCGWYTATTANHLNHIRAALPFPRMPRFSYVESCKMDDRTGLME